MKSTASITAQATKDALLATLARALEFAPDECIEGQWQPSVRAAANGTELVVWNLRETIAEVIRRLGHVNTRPATTQPQVARAAVRSSSDVLLKQAEYVLELERKRRQVVVRRASK